MRGRLVFAGAVLAICAASELPAMAGAPVADWSGFYLGAVAGYGTGTATTDGSNFFNDTAGTSFAGSIPGISYGASGFLGGAEAGYSWQANGLVFGLVGDIAATGISGDFTDTVFGYSTDTHLNWLSTLRAQLGMPFGHALIYGTGGLAIGGVQANLHDNYGIVVNTSDSQTAVGYAVGAGIAAALDQHWVVRAEYQYVDLGKQTFSFNEPSPPGWPLITSVGHNTQNLIRFALDYRF